MTNLSPFKSIFKDGEYLLLPVVRVDVTVYIVRHVGPVWNLADYELAGVSLPPDEEPAGVAGQGTVEARPCLVSVDRVEVASPGER